MPQRIKQGLWACFADAAEGCRRHLLGDFEDTITVNGFTPAGSGQRIAQEG